MGKKNKEKKEKMDKCLQKFAIKGQEKLVGQLRQMLNYDQKKQTPNKINSIAKADDLLNSLRNAAGKNIHLNNVLYFEIYCRPIYYPTDINKIEVLETLQKISKINNDKYFDFSLPEKQTSQLELKATQFDCIANQKSNNSQFWVFIPQNGLFYIRNSTSESKQNNPNIFDPKVQSITMAKCLVSIGRLYQSCGLSYRDKLNICFGYYDAKNLAVGSISPETFLPSNKFNNQQLSINNILELHKLLSQTAETSAEIIIELLKQLNYQGIVNKNFFVHAVSKYLAQN